MCATCCYRCEHHVSFSGIWSCGFVTPEQKKADVQRRIQNRFDEENRKISEAYMKRRREEAKKRAIKAAKARKK